MATPSPSEFIDALAERVLPILTPLLQPAAGEVRHRLVLLLNHVLGQEPEAMVRLARQKGRVVELSWREWHLRLQASAAGLLEQAPEGVSAHLTLTVAEASPWALAQAALRGEKPPVRIAGDVQLAAEVNWLVDHVRWDLEEDLARLLGDAPAHTLAQGGRQAAAALRAFVVSLAERFPLGSRSPSEVSPVTRTTDAGGSR
jgi:ubiquinone biosynthesis protein UbiJ